MKTDSWDDLAQIFAKDKSLEDIPPEAADNILIAWPVFLNFIKTYTDPASDRRALDYGCGGGRFAAKLNTLGYAVTGIDSSTAMIDSARNHYGKHVTFIAGDESSAREHGPFSLITSIMTFQFVADVEQLLPVLLASLAPGGLFIFATHNPDFVKDSIQAGGARFVDFDSTHYPTQGAIAFGDTKIPLYLRNSNQYQALLEPLGCRLLLEESPPFTKEFLANYSMSGPTEHSEYLILGFRKI